MGCPPPDDRVYTVSSPQAAALTQELLQPLVERNEFEGALRISGGALDGADMGSGDTWPWASVTKQVVATLVMQDVERGALSLDTPVSVYLKEWPSGPEAPTLRQLLRHQSGLYDPEDDAGFVFDTLRPLDPMLCAERRTQAPGGDFDYNNCDTLIVGRVLERVNGEALETLFQTRIAEPSGILFAKFVTPDTRLAASENGASASEIALYGAAGGLAGPPNDLVRFDRALMEDRLLSEEAREEMWDGVPNLGYTALGQWEAMLPLDGCDEPVRVIERRGAVRGYQARNFIIPDFGIAVVAFTPRGEEEYAFGEPWSREGFSFELLSVAVCTK
ncbi:beta-lactamase family protein [Qipengyuania aurantiaca]|uniref:Beta-lactamase family protein n=1 Tax=Qipengyuania aurantiaca TaxID=2867233 RepID=A0ABX8ZJE3_9SPHN|nr:serine hydrolase domain-containing protein [Qipengyuania aurantiaca]QZD89141.1 beta-lactamase family protein [Qipengyuania aurantiaca]